MTDALRRQLADLLDGHGAHMPFEEAVADLADDAINARAPNVQYTPWHLVEHVRITQWDILEYVRSREHVSPPWPEGMWPARDATADRLTFDTSVARYLADRADLRVMVMDSDVDLLATIPSTPGHSLAREVRIAADHTAYHTGEFAILRQVMGTWPEGRQG